MRADVSVVVPVFRNAATLPELHRRLCAALADRVGTFEIVYVDDACPAGSSAVLRDLAAGDPSVALVALSENVGQHRAVLAGLATARGEWVVVLDADLQDPPEAIGELLAHRHGVAAVFAGRRGRYESPARLFTSRLFKRTLHLLSGVPADAGLFVAMHRTLVERLLAMAGPRPFIVSMIGCAGLPMRSIPVQRASRPVGRSAYSAWARVASGWRGVAWVLGWRYRRLLGHPGKEWA